MLKNDPNHVSLMFLDYQLFQPFHIPNPSAVIRCMAEAPGGGYCNKPIGHIGPHSMEEPMPDKHETQGMLRTHSGGWFDINDPYNSDIIIEDIAHALSMICRYNGQIPSFYSVAEHCCHVADWLDTHGYKHLMFAGLMHDAAEAYVGDIIRPMKIMPGFQEVYNEMEMHVELAISNEFNVDLYPMNPIVKEADMAVYEWEVKNIRSGKMKGLTPEDAYQTFMAFFRHYQPPKNFTRESQMKNTPEVANYTDADMDFIEADEKRITEMSDAEIAEEAEIIFDGDPMDLSEEAEQKLMNDIADLDASVAEAAHAEKMPWGPRRQMLMNAADLVDGDRNAQYGDPRQDFRRTAAYWNTHINGIIERKLAENNGQMNTDNLLGLEDVAIMMSLLKVSRLAWQPAKEDTWTDLAGYAACGWHCAMPEEG